MFVFVINLCCCLFLFSLDPFSEASNQNVQMLKEENCRLAEELMVRSGETSILRVDLQQFKMKFQKRETETSQQIAELRKQIAISEALHNKELDAQRTEMKFRVSYFTKLLLCYFLMKCLFLRNLNWKRKEANFRG